MGVSSVPVVIVVVMMVFAILFNESEHTTTAMNLTWSIRDHHANCHDYDCVNHHGRDCHAHARGHDRHENDPDGLAGEAKPLVDISPAPT